MGYAPGLLVAVVLAVVAFLVGRQAPVVGSPVIGIVCGVMVSAFVRRHALLRPGVSFAGRTVLQVAVVVLGAQLSLRRVADVGLDSLPVMLGTLGVCLVLAYLVGRWMGIERDLRTLIGVGTAICGASAIAAVSPVIRAKHASVAYAISTIFLFNVAAVLVFPPLGHLLGLDQHAFGLFAGTAVNDTSSVVAVAASYGDAASQDAVVVKLTRALMIIPICLVLSALVQRRDRRTAPPSEGRLMVKERMLRRAVRLVPWFLVGFLLMAAVNSAGMIPPSAHDGVQSAALFLITVALTAIGMSTDLASLRRAGHRPLLLGLMLWVAVAATSLLLQMAGL
ncbi:putative sulfate exporter family transporter [Dactylosporangium sp. NPDC051484]|uniref:YeiH family protein n=1 Tax=Dactylosporangium sp. NPDC051484 TaxID=3154942 RepID=UPI00344C30EE